MNKKVLIVIIGVALLIGGALAYVFFTPKSDEVDDISTTQLDAAPAVEQTSDEAAAARTGIYAAYSDAAIVEAQGVKLLFFHAPWCPQCREMEASIEEDGIPTGVTVFKIDYDTSQSLRQKYGVTLQTTFVKIDDQGNKVSSYVAYDEPQFSSVERELLP